MEREKYLIYADFKKKGREEESSRGEKKMRVGKSTIDFSGKRS